ncbi:MAG: RluA family pseudouridine synthase, partial [Muribaculaceae bacterium]|nr:RluA family pseudouridine synthase [Muribaculaceae bacterium]
INKRDAGMRMRGGWDPDRILRRANKGEADVALLDFVGSVLPDAKRGDLKKWLKFGHISVDGQVTSAFDAPVAPGSVVEVNFTRPFVVFRHPRLKLVYEDDDIIVVDKGYGLLSVGTDSSKKNSVETAYSILREYVKSKHPSNKIFIVHRLDRDTSGLMVFAKTIESKEALQHNWNNMVLERKYVALLDGELEKESGEIRSHLAETIQHEVYSTEDPSEGKLAVTRYKVRRRGKGHTLAEFSLDTGRKNQIRVHARDLGCPITGDKRYGNGSGPLHRLALHAETLRFAHPVSRLDMNFTSPVPSQFYKYV